MRTLAPGTRVALASIRVAELLAWLGDDPRDPAETGLLVEFAAHLARQGRIIPWPPGRNDACWCGSGRKYKRCCEVL